MTTRLYLHSIGAPAFTPAVGSIWELTAPYQRLDGLTYSTGSPNMTGPAGSFSADMVGKAASGTAVPGGATIASVTDDTHAALSANFTTNATGAGQVTVAYTGPLRRPMGLTPSTARNYAGMSKSVATNPSDMLLGQWVLDYPLDAQTITGSFGVSFAAYEDNNLLNAITQARLFLIDSSGAEYAELYAGHVSTTTGSAGTPANNQEWQGTNAGAAAVRYFSVSVTSQAVSAGSRLVLELGARCNTANTGNNPFARIGGPSGDTDAPAAGNGTASTAGTLRTWLELSHTLTELLVPGAPTSLGEVHDTDSIDFSWSAPASGGTPTGYHVRLDGGTPVDVGLVLAHTFGSLAAATSYDLEVRAYNLAGNGPWALLADVVTDSADPEIPEDLEATPVPGGTITLTWSPPSTGPTPTSYEVRVLEVSGGAVTDVGLVFSHDFTGLAEATAYTLQVRSKTSSGVSAWAELVAYSSPPEGYYSVEVTAGGYAWSATSLEGVDPSTYGVRLPLALGWSIPDAVEFFPAQADPTTLVFQVLAESAGDLEDLVVGSAVAFQMYLSADPGEPAWQTFQGIVTQLDGQTVDGPEAGTQEWLATVYCADDVMRLASMTVGFTDDWPIESIGDRLDRICTEAGQTLNIAALGTGEEGWLAARAGDRPVDALTAIRDTIKDLAFENASEAPDTWYGRAVVSYDPDEAEVRVDSFERRVYPDATVTLDGHLVYANGSWVKRPGRAASGWVIVDGTTFGTPPALPGGALDPSSPPPLVRNTSLLDYFGDPPGSETNYSAATRDNLGEALLTGGSTLLDGWYHSRLVYDAAADPDPVALWASFAPITQVIPVMVTPLKPEYELNGVDYLAGTLTGARLVIPPGGEFFLELRLRPELLPGSDTPSG